MDVEEWFHILDASAAPPLAQWDSLPSRLAGAMETILTLLSETGTRATFFWLGWAAERHKDLVRRCAAMGHEVGSHGYGHLLAFRCGRDAFREDVHKARCLLQDISGGPVLGYRAPGFGITEETPWAFEVIRDAGHEYDASLFPAARGHGGMRQGRTGPHVIPTSSGDLAEVPVSVIDFCGKRMSLFGGGYLRLAPQWLISWGIRRLRAAGQPLVVYLHPREVDPDHPRLPLTPYRRFKCYVNMHTMIPKLRWMCSGQKFCTMSELVAETVGLRPRVPGGSNGSGGPEGNLLPG